MKLPKIFAFLTKKNGEGKTVVKENEATGEVTYSKEDAESIETAIGRLGEVEAELTTATETNTTLTAERDGLTAKVDTLTNRVTELEAEVETYGGKKGIPDLKVVKPEADKTEPVINQYETSVDREARNKRASWPKDDEK